MKQNITYTTVHSYQGVTLSLVKDSGRVLGFIETRPNTATEIHPIKAFKAIVGQGPVRLDSTAEMRAYYGRSAKAQAIAYLRTLTY